MANPQAFAALAANPSAFAGSPKLLNASSMSANAAQDGASDVRSRGPFRRRAGLASHPEALAAISKNAAAFADMASNPTRSSPPLPSRGSPRMAAAPPPSLAWRATMRDEGACRRPPGVQCAGRQCRLLQGAVGTAQCACRGGPERRFVGPDAAVGGRLAPGDGGDVAARQCVQRAGRPTQGARGDGRSFEGLRSACRHLARLRQSSQRGPFAR